MSDTKLTFTGKVANGKLTPSGKKFWPKVFEQFEGKKITVTVERAKRQRSPEQNRYYWGVVVPIIARFMQDWNPDMEITREIVHEWCKVRFLKKVKDWDQWKVKTPDGEKELEKTTTVLTTVEFMDYIALIQQWAAEFDIYIPDPQEWAFDGEAVDVEFA